jgi:hypothetical protein
VNSSIVILRSVARRLGKRVRQCENYDANVCEFEANSETGWNAVVVSGHPFSEELRYFCGAHRVHLQANPEYLFCSVSGQMDVGVCSINRPNEISPMRPTGLIVAGGRPCPVFASLGSRSQGESEALASFLDHPDVRKAVKQVLRHESESIHIFKGSIALYFRPQSPEELLSAIDVLVEVMDLFAPQDDGIDLADLPLELRCLAPLIRRWSVSDDSERDHLLEESTQSDLEELLKAVGPHLSAIDHYLDSFKGKLVPEVATAVGALAECAIEARLRLTRR